MVDPHTPTEAIICAMEHADDMEEAVIIYRLKEGRGVGWVSMIETTSGKFALIEEAKLGMFLSAYGVQQDGD